jgi:hypothetical protein
VSHVLKESSQTYGLFGLVLGLIAWIYLGAVLVVFAAEINVVSTDRLWPRALLTPFTDNVQLTPGDERAYTSYAATERYKGYQRITVDFGHTGHGADPEASLDPGDPVDSDDESGTPWAAR